MVPVALPHTMLVKVALEGIVTEAFERSTTPLKVVVPFNVVFVAVSGPEIVVVPAAKLVNVAFVPVISCTVVEPLSVFGPEVVNPPFIVVVARFVVPVAIRLLVVILVPVALSKTRLEM